MAISILADAGQNTTGTGVEVTGPCTVYCRGVIAGAPVILEMARTDVSSDYAIEHIFKGAGQRTVDGKGTYFLRGRVGEGSERTSVSLDAEQDA